MNVAPAILTDCRRAFLLLSRTLLKKVRYSAGRYYAHHVSIFYARPSGA